MELLMPKTKPTTVTEYISAAPKHAQKKLREIRAILKKVAPNATEKLKWGSPGFEKKMRDGCIDAIRRAPPNKGPKLPAHVGVFDLSPVRCRLSAIRYPDSA